MSDAGGGGALPAQTRLRLTYHVLRDVSGGAGFEFWCSPSTRSPRREPTARGRHHCHDIASHDPCTLPPSLPTGRAATPVAAGQTCRRRERRQGGTDGSTGAKERLLRD